MRYQVRQRRDGWLVAALSAAVLTAMAAVGCGAPDRDPTREGERGLIESNGVRFNGVRFNGVRFNGVRFNGVRFNGVRFNGVRFNGVRFNGSVLHGSLNGVNLSGADFLGSEMDAELSDGSTVVLRIDDVRKGVGNDSDILHYAVSYSNEGAWHPLCGLSSQPGPVFAIAVPGTWDYREGVQGGGAKIDDPSLFTFACQDSAIAKCAEFGYRPWTSATTASLAEHHQACVRMIRADYCGDGRSWTRNGTPINVYDNLGIEADSEAWGFEAEWTVNGASCITPGMTRYAAPDCAPQLYSSSCGDSRHFQSGTLLMNENTRTLAADSASAESRVLLPASRLSR